MRLLKTTGDEMRPTYLVWVSSPDGAKTMVVRELDTGLEVIGSHRGLFICDGKRLLKWRATRHSILLPEWNSRDSQGNATSEHEAPVEDIDLTDFDTGSAMRITPVEPRERDVDYDFERETRVIASAGPFLFLTEHIFRFGGGAHPNRWVRFYVVDVRTGIEVDSLSAAAWADWFRAEREQAIAEYRATEEFVDEWDVKKCELTLYRPVATSQGLTKIELQFTFGAAYAGSDNLWGSYTRSRRLRSGRLPPELANLITPPFPLLAFLGAYGNIAAVGWSIVPDVLRAEQWIAQFKPSPTAA